VYKGVKQRCYAVALYDYYCCSFPQAVTPPYDQSVNLVRGDSLLQVIHGLCKYWTSIIQPQQKVVQSVWLTLYVEHVSYILLDFVIPTLCPVKVRTVN